LYNESPHIARARELLNRAAATEPTTTDAPTGITTTEDIQRAEAALAHAQAELRSYEQSSDGMRESLSEDGKKGVVIEKLRFDRIDALRAKIVRRRNDLTFAKKSWLAGVIGEDH
jgi:multidrug resistance efflux pump